MADLLKRILKDVRMRLAERKAACPLSAMVRCARGRPTPPDFVRAIGGKHALSVIAELKRASPSSPKLSPKLDPAKLAREYAGAGAAALSVLTEQDHFSGRLDDLQTAAAVSGLPVLRKDFTVDEYQIYESKVFGAAAVLLIVRALPPEDLRTLIRLAGRLDLAPLVEIHNEKELDTALDAGARIIGVNNRNLSTLRTDLGVCRRILPRVPADCVAVAESGYSMSEEMAELEGMADAVLIGTAFLKNRKNIQSLINR